MKILDYTPKYRITNGTLNTLSVGEAQQYFDDRRTFWIECYNETVAKIVYSGIEGPLIFYIKENKHASAPELVQDILKEVENCYENK